MGSKNRRAVQAAPSEFIPKHPTEIMAHPAMVLTGNILTLTIDYCGPGSPIEKSTSMKSLLTILPDYAPYVKILQLSIHAGIPHMEPPSIYTSRIADMKSIVGEINKFKKLEQVRIRMLVDYCSFPQMKLAAAMFGVRQEVQRTLQYVVRGEEPVRVEVENDTMRRLNGVWRKEFL
ncbi:uncharacterized protein EAF01_003991 [Botrytis porri]|uniref:Uncharacterized protein n=1 Tax=Botrytis porri TaxID=87229 RepID=A0A4Z1KH26_9HELO|nr:uncharacterized protein EAF01_003991 [Botrytis porri]KAF7908236.1 hypothetical protein EAF01_003991 [Botrytis porri]TGO85367.1 hypothetical protein BPOR_0403g00030 [Botrytis porri]